MFEATNRQPGLIGWGASILIHTGLLIFGAVWLIQPARFHVEPGKTSTEIDLIFTTAPVPVKAAPTPPVPRAQPAPTPEPIKRQASALSKPNFKSPPLIAVSAKPQPPRPTLTPKASPATETSSASRGAVQAQPDELQNEPPAYPEESRMAREEGVVILQVEVTAAGEPVRVSILKSSGYFRLDQAARRAVQSWKFHPALTAGLPVSSEADVPVHFRLE